MFSAPSLNRLALESSKRLSDCLSLSLRFQYGAEQQPTFGQAGVQAAVEEVGQRNMLACGTWRIARSVRSR